MSWLRFLKLPGARKRRDVTLFPAFWLMDINILEQQKDWRHVEICLPLNFFNRHGGGAMFGGAQASLADPIPAMACAQIFPGYSVWTRDLTLDFREPGITDLTLRFDMDPAQEAQIREELARRGRATPSFELGYYLADGTCCTIIRNTVAIRPKGYQKLTKTGISGPPITVK
jgi:acyl-coenzyme A thioesterase PaaI-like protein